MNQRAGLEPAGLKGRNIDDLGNRAIRAEDDLESVIEREAVATRGALAPPDLRRGLEQKKILTGAVECQRAGQSGQARTDNENHAVRRGRG